MHIAPAAPPAVPTTRRDFLGDAAFGLPVMAAASLLLQDRLLAVERPPTRQAVRHFEPRATQVPHIFLGGGLSQVDSFDYKPELEKYHDQEVPASIGQAAAFFGKIGRLHKSHYAFKQRGASGLWVSDLFPHLAEVADELTVINSMVAETANHIPGIFQANTGFRQMGFPSMGSWLSYGLGSENSDLPAFVVLPDARGIPNSAGGAFNWTNGFLPAQHQGVAFNTKGGAPILDHHPQGFTNILAGVGLNHGTAYGATDPVGYAAIEHPVTTYDLHATILRLLGIDHERLTFYHNGIQRRLTNMHGHVVHGILA